MESREGMTFFSVVIILGLINPITAKSFWPKDGFQFNCGPDLCTFPNQYCDTSNEVCKYCNSDLCNTDEIPQQCQNACSGEATTTLSTTKVSLSLAMSPKQGGQDQQTAGGQWTVSLGNAINIGISGTILIILISTICYKLKTKFADDKKQKTMQKVIQNGEYHQIPDGDQTAVMSVMSTQSNQSGSTDSGLGNLNNANKTDLNNSESGVSEDNDISRDPPLTPTAPQKDIEVTESTSDNLRDIHTHPETTEHGKDERQFDPELMPKNEDTSPRNNTDSSPSEHIELSVKPNSGSSEHICKKPQGTARHPVEEGTSSQHKQYLVEQQSTFTKAKQLPPGPGKHTGKAYSKDSGLSDSSEETFVKYSQE